MVELEELFQQICPSLQGSGLFQVTRIILYPVLWNSKGSGTCWFPEDAIMPGLHGYSLTLHSIFNSLSRSLTWNRPLWGGLPLPPFPHSVLSCHALLSWLLKLLFCGRKHFCFLQSERLGGLRSILF